MIPMLESNCTIYLTLFYKLLAHRDQLVWNYLGVKRTLNTRPQIYGKACSPIETHHFDKSETEKLYASYVFLYLALRALYTPQILNT
jgi:hypothetical protein